MRRWLVGLIAGGALLVPASADEGAQKMDAAMEAMMKAATPGAEHARMAKYAGKWKTKVTSYMNPGQPETSESTSERTMIMGGRFMIEKVSGTFGGQPFEGMSITGFDNVDKKIHWTWADNFGTGMMHGVGTCDAGHKRCVSNTEMNDPMTGKVAKGRMVETYVDDNHYTFEMYGTGPDGKEMMMMKAEAARQ